MTAIATRTSLQRGAAFAALLLVGCATPGERFDDRASALRFDAMVIAGDGFTHRAYTAGTPRADAALHVYIEHDGTPWIETSRVSADPTPRWPLALELMARDSGPRLLLGRPCYFTPAQDARCNALLWTHQRYSPEVIGSMIVALRRYLAAHPHRQVVLIGYSGGGTIAWLMAERMSEATGIVTIAANLDIDEWTRIHGYSALTGSLNPALLPPLAGDIAQLHFVGGRDANVPPSVVRSFARRHPGARVVEIAEFDHVCCWIERWPQLIVAAPTAR